MKAAAAIFVAAAVVSCSAGSGSGSGAQRRAPLRILALGDSYTIGESVAVDDRWPVQLAAALRDRGLAVDDPQIIAKTGWTTDELTAAIAEATRAARRDGRACLVDSEREPRPAALRAGPAHALS